MNFAEQNGTFCFGDIPKWLLGPPPPPISGQNIDEVTEKETDLIKKYCGEGRQRGSAGVGGGGLRGGGKEEQKKKGEARKAFSEMLKALQLINRDTNGGHMPLFYPSQIITQ